MSGCKHCSNLQDFDLAPIKVNQAQTLWWNFFTALDVLLLLLYSQLRDDLSPKAVFYINNIIWFLGLDIFHLYLTVKLWMRDTPSLKDVQREIDFYPRKPSILEPRRPMLENREVVFDNRRDQGLDKNSELSSALWKGKGGKGKKRSIGNYETRKEDEKNEERVVYSLSKRSMSSPNLPPVSD